MRSTEKKSPRRRARGRRTRHDAQTPVQAAPDSTAEVVSAPAEAWRHPVEAVPSAVPEAVFAARTSPPPPPRPLPARRHAIFFDVENTSRPEHIARVIQHLAIDRLGRQTDLVAVGNWRVASQETARLLAGHGAQLVHSAPSTGVRDWSDLRIAVTAGVWLAGARAGDVIEIVSDDRAFDAVGDVAASLGVAYRRLSFRGLAGIPSDDVPERAVEGEARGGRRGGGRRRGRREGAPRPGHHAPQRPHHHAPPTSAPGAEPHTAPHDEIVGLAHELITASDRGAVTLDTLANALKSRGFRRPPGSPRLITRLRRIKEIDVSRAGLVTLSPSAPPQGPGSAFAELEPVPAPEPGEVTPVVEPAERATGEGPPRRSRRRGRRGGRRRRRAPTGVPQAVAE